MDLPLPFINKKAYFINLQVPDNSGEEYFKYFNWMNFLKLARGTYEILVRYKIHHLGFWFLYHYFWWALMSGSPYEAIQNIFFSPYSIKFLCYVLLQALGVYFNLYYLIPKFLQKRLYAQYIILLLVTILITASGIVGGYYLNALATGLSFESLFGLPPSEFYELFKTNALPSTLASMTLAMSIKLTKHWISSEKRRNAIERENLQTELKFLRSQYNPHFLFNTINSIFTLIHKDQDEASKALAKFSELLRYQLYQCNDNSIPLNQELDYLENFIELEKLRHDFTHLGLEFKIERSSENVLEIAPFLLVPFVENAFKHVSRNKHSENYIRIELTVMNNLLKLHVANSKEALSVSNENLSRGIGLTNVSRRLQLLYPNRHVLTIKNSHQYHEVFLELQLKSLVSNQNLIA